MSKALNIFEFSNYRSYLKEWMEAARSQHTTNFTKMAQAIGVHSSFLTHVMSGAKNFSFEQATEVSDFLKHTNLEREYFFALLQIERAGTRKLQAYWLEKKQQIQLEREKLSSRVGMHHELSAEDRAIFYSSWLYVAIYVATAIDNGQSLEQIAEMFEIPRNKVEEVLSFLTKCGICQYRDGIYQMGPSVVYLGNLSPLVMKHHTNWRMKAIQKMDSREDNEVFFTSPMSMSMADFAKAREIIAQSIQEILKICKDSPAEEVVCLDIDLFRVAKKT